MNTNMPAVGDCILGEVRRVAEMGAYVYLPDYDRVGEGVVLLSELSDQVCCDHPTNLKDIVKVGQKILVKVIYVDEKKGYIDLSRTKVTPEEIAKAEKQYNMQLVIPVKRMPAVGESVLAEVRCIQEMGVHVRLSDYTCSGFIILSELSADWWDAHHDIKTMVRIGERFPVKVLRVHSNYVDLSKIRV